MSEVRLVVAILVPAIFTLILKDFFDLFMTNRYEGKVKQYTIWMLYFLLDTAISMNFKFVGVISMLYSFIILIIFCAVLYREDIKYITLTVLFIICIGAASELIVALGIRAFLNSSQLQQFSLFGSTCSKLIILIIVRIVKLFRVSGIKRLDYMNWLANVSMTAGSLYIVYNLYLLSLNETKLLGSTMSSIIILLLNVICFKMFGSGLKSSILKGKKYDLIYLDIEMRQMNGIATAKYIRSIDTTVLLIYVSNYDNYLKELFEVEPFRFMSKPINDKRFYMFLDLAIDRIRSANGIYCFRFNKDILTVILRDVIYFESCGSRVHIVLKGKLYKFYKKLDDVEKEISVNYSIPFIRIHKSYLVNFQQIRKVGYTEVETKDGRILNISDTYKKDVRARYSKLLWDGDV